MKNLNKMTDEEIQEWIRSRSTYIDEEEEEEYRECVKTLDKIADILKSCCIPEFNIYGHALYSLGLDFAMYMDVFGCRMPLSCFRKENN